MIKVDGLWQISPLYGRAKLDLAATVLVAQQALDKGGLTCTIIAEDRDPFTALHIEIHV